MNMRIGNYKLSDLFALSVTAAFLLFFCGCGGVGSTPAPAPGPLSAANTNLIFVVSGDLDYQAPGDISASTANLTNQGLQRSLLMAPFLEQNVLGGENVTGIYALEPMAHLQTASAGSFPDMAALETVQQFAMLNQITQPEYPVGTTLYTANSFQLNASYSPGQTLPDVAAPLIYCQGCQGLDFGGPGSDNEALAKQVLGYAVPGFYVFSAPWETTSSLLAGINTLEGYNLPLPASYQGPNYIYAISVAPSGSASLVTYNSNVNPPLTYPALPALKLNSPCSGGQTPMNITVTGGVNGVIPEGINTSETIYMIRHAEAHPTQWFDDGNYVAAGQWRALGLPSALAGKLNPSPTQVYSIDPAQEDPSGYFNWSYVRPSLTAEPYAIANNLPYHLAASFEMFNIPIVIEQTTQFFFNSPQYPSTPSILYPQPPSFSGQTVLLAWEHAHFQPTVNALLESYQSTQRAPVWADDDYDTIWTVTTDAVGNLTVNNAMCEGINSGTLPATAPQF